MIRNKVLLISSLFVVIAILSSCSSTSEPLEIDYGWVAVQANYYEQGFSHIYLVNYNNPGNFKQITFGDHNYETPRFSPDRNDIIIGDHSSGTPDNPALICYNNENDTIEYLMETVPHEDDFIVGNDVVWHPDGDTFYFYIWGSFQLPDMHSYTLSTEEHILLTRDNDIAEFVVDFIDANTMITWYSEHWSQGTEDNGYYLMDIDGNYLSKITNPHLVYLVVDVKIYQAALNLRYNPSSELIVFTQKDSLLSGLNIAVTNLEGTYFKRYTSGYRDDNPCWGPGDNIVLFDRAELDDKGRKYTTIMKLNLNSGNVTEFLRPSILEGAEGVSHPDY